MEIIRDGWIGHFTDERLNIRRIKIISPFITHGIVREILSARSFESMEVITRFNLNDFLSGASDLRALKLLVNHGALIQGIKNLHSKVYIIDDASVIIGSANLTTNAFYNNYEFGLKLVTSAEVQQCVDYFTWLKDRGGVYLTIQMIEAWEDEIRGRQPAADANALPDRGVDPNLSFVDKRYFIKFLGNTDNRVGDDFPCRDQIAESHSHYALCFSQEKGKPMRYNDGDIVYMARMLYGTNYSIYGKAEALKHIDGRDYASEEEMEILDWKERWPLYIRVKNPVFVDTIMSNCPKMSDLIDDLGPECFKSTSMRLARGEIGINPWNSLRQQADIELSQSGAMWLERQFNLCLNQFDKVDEVFINSLHQGTPC